MNKKSIVITGGHFTPGLAVIERLRIYGWKIHWIGVVEAFEGKKSQTLESKVLADSSIKFWPITTPKFNRRSPVFSMLSLWKFPVGIFQSIKILSSIRPSVILSFGSYVSVPVSLVSWILRIPLVIHEQTTASGLANRIAARIAYKVAVSFPVSAVEFPAGKAVLVGNPVRGEIHEIGRSRSRKSVGKRPTLYITGGSRGSQIINQAVGEVLSEILKLCRVFHQTGSLDLAKVQSRGRRLQPNLRKDYHIKDNFTPDEVGRIYKKADLVVSRAGANTISELVVVGIPAILIPIPWVESDEQNKNARLLASEGSATILPESDLSGGSLLAEIKEVLGKIDYYRVKAKRLKKKGIVPEDAVERIVSLIEKARRNK
ncbi:hypothetical protein CMO96_01535 [Candidatus Woesebacteria bacterium]|nr:hypothetical protein [Candidatus Woesebacteria bacterium]